MNLFYYNLAPSLVYELWTKGLYTDNQTREATGMTDQEYEDYWRNNHEAGWLPTANCAACSADLFEFGDSQHAPWPRLVDMAEVSFE